MVDPAASFFGDAPGYQVDFQGLYDQIRSVTTVMNVQPPPVVLDQINLLDGKLDGVYRSLSADDEKIAASWVRRFFEKVRTEDEKLLLAILRFYFHSRQVSPEERGRQLTHERAEVERLRRVDVAKSEFVAVAAHEFRTPLAAVIGVLSTLREHGNVLSPEDRRELIDGAMGQANRLARTVDDLLTVLPNFSLVPQLLLGSISVAIVALAQGAGISTAVPNPDGSRASQSRDFIGEGLGNLAGSLFQSMGTGGSLSRTGVSVGAGANSRLGGVPSGVLLGVILLLFVSSAEKVPLAVIGGMLVVIGIELIMARVPSSEAGAQYR